MAGCGRGCNTRKGPQRGKVREGRGGVWVEIKAKEKQGRGFQKSRKEEKSVVRAVLSP